MLCLDAKTMTYYRVETITRPAGKGQCLNARTGRWYDVKKVYLSKAEGEAAARAEYLARQSRKGRVS